MYGLAGFRFTLTLIFPYDELVFFAAQVLGAGRRGCGGQKCSISLKILSLTQLAANSAVRMHSSRYSLRCLTYWNISSPNATASMLMAGLVWSFIKRGEALGGGSKAV